MGILFFSLKTPQPIAFCGVTDFESFCGTANLSENAFKGKQIFNSNCAACHKLDEIMTGPPLRGIAEKYDSVAIQKYLRVDKTTIDSKGFNETCVYFPQLTDIDIRDLLAYTN